MPVTVRREEANLSDLNFFGGVFRQHLLLLLVRQELVLGNEMVLGNVYKELLLLQDKAPN
jgi:hypothetical protein